MTEAEWLACDDADRMLQFLRDRMSEKKCRLWACACCRRAWHLLKDERSRKAVEAAERLAEGQASWQELREAHEQASEAFSQAPRGRAIPHSLYCAMVASVCASTAAHPDEAGLRRGEVAARTADAAALALGGRPGDPRKWQAHLLRDSFNPFGPFSLSPTLLTPTVLALANAAYTERDLPSGHLQPARLAVLADALEEAGCPDPDLPGHLRSSGPHVRGCWAVDLVLGKE